MRHEATLSPPLRYLCLPQIAGVKVEQKGTTYAVLSAVVTETASQVRHPG